MQQEPQQPPADSAGDSSEGDEEEDEEEEDEEEPKLRYRRLAGNVPELLKKDVASCMAVSTKLLALGTHDGVVYLCDFHGHVLKDGGGRPIGKFPLHSSMVQELCFSDNCEYLASCGDDGKVVIFDLFNEKGLPLVHYTRSFNRPVLAVALDPRYGKSNDRSMFVSGGRAGKLILCKKGFLGVGIKEVVLSVRDEGCIRAIAWKGRFIAWANDMAVNIYDVEGEEAITRTEKPPGPWRPDVYRCSLSWASDRTIVIGWEKTIKIGQILVREDPAVDEPMHFMQVSRVFAMDCAVCGLAPFGNFLCVLAYREKGDDDDDDDDDDDERGTTAGAVKALPAAPTGGKPQEPVPARPELRVIDPSATEDSEKSADLLPIEGFERYNPTNYRLRAMGAESIYYIVSPRDIVVATPRDLDDHIEWLRARRRFEQAFLHAEQAPQQLKKFTLLGLGEELLEHLLVECNEPAKCAAYCPRVLRGNAAGWEKWIFHFVKKLQVQAIAGYIPIKNPKLSKLVYEAVLFCFLKYDHARFLQTIREWHGHDLYDPETIINAVNQVRDNEEGMKSSDILSQALAELYGYAGQFDQALHIFLRLKRGNPFELIERHRLFAKVRDNVVALIEFDPVKAMDLLINHLADIPVASVVEQLKKDRRLLHIYLDTLYRKNPQAGAEFHELQVSLYAEFDYPRLMNFLRMKLVKPEVALEVCRSKQLYPEMVYILAQIGDRSTALKLLIEKIGSVAAAIKFIEEHDANDMELWEYLINEALKSPARISELLEHVGGVQQVNPIKLIRRIPEGMQIPNLRDRLVKIISDYGLAQSLREGSAKILETDSVKLQQKLVSVRKVGIHIDSAAVCSKCRVPLVIDDGLRKTGAHSAVIFQCGHVFHAQCLLPSQEVGGETMEAQVQAALTKESLKRQTDFVCQICYRGNKK